MTTQDDLTPLSFGSTGDLRLRPDHDSAHVLTGVTGRPDTTIVLADIVHTDGRPWACCPRTFMRDAVATPESEFGLAAIFASLTVSYLRLLPHQWSSAAAFLGLHNREALDALEQDEVVTGWFAPELVATYLRIKRAELEEVSPLSQTERCAWYARAY